MVQKQALFASGEMVRQLDLVIRYLSILVYFLFTGEQSFQSIFSIEGVVMTNGTVEPAIFTSDLEDQTSQPFKDLAKKVCGKVSDVY